MEQADKLNRNSRLQLPDIMGDNHYLKSHRQMQKRERGQNQTVSPYSKNGGSMLENNYSQTNIIVDA